MDKSAKSPSNGSAAKIYKARPIRATSDIREMVLEALHRAGGEHYLRRQAVANPVAFLGLVGRVLPLQAKASAAGMADQAITVNVSWLSPERLAYNRHQQPVEVVEALPVDSIYD